MAGTLDQQYTTGAFDAVIGYDSNYKYRYMSFTVGLAGAVSQVDVKLKKNGTPTRTYYLEIWDDNSGVPNSKVSDTVSIDSSTIATSHTFYSYNIVNGPIAAVSDKLHIVIYSDTFSTSNYLGWAYNNSSGYAGGNTGRGSTVPAWTAEATYDCQFKTYMLAAGGNYKNMLLMGIG